MYRSRASRLAPVSSAGHAAGSGSAGLTHRPRTAGQQTPSSARGATLVTTEKSQTFAVLRDDRGVYHGREGDIIEGRYRILKIGAESIELAYVDGRGRQTIRLGS